MILHVILAAGAFLSMFVLFLVLGRTLNAILNQLMKLEYLVRKELELQKEVVAIRKLLAEDAAATEGDTAQGE